MMKLFLLCAALLSARAVQAGGSHDKSKRGDGFYKPLVQNAFWKLYQFDVTMVQKVDSFRSAPDPFPPNDPNQPGSIASLTTEVFDKANGQKIGIGSWGRFVVSNDPAVPGQEDGDRIARRLLLVAFEFGAQSAEFPDALSVTVLTKWLLSSTKPSDFTDYEGLVSAGRGRFLGATGQVSVKDIVIVDDLLKSATFSFQLFVPNNLPKA